MEKAFFTRKAVNIEKLKKRTGPEEQKHYFVIEKVVELSTEDYVDFQDNLMDDFEFIFDNMNTTFIDNNGIWHTILIKSKDSIDGICCNAEGYAYCRYGAYIPDCSIYTSYPLSDLVKGQILAIRDKGEYNMFDVNGIQREALKRGFHELVIFLEEHRGEYSKFILYGK